MERTAVGSRPEGSGYRTKAQPLRTCVGCRRRDRQSHVIRVVARLIGAQSVVVVDERRRLSGRGAWLHPDTACLETAVKRRAFNRAFRAPVDTAQFAVDFRAYLERRDARSDPSSSLKAGQYPHGNPMSTQR